ncbi:hypothetical protein [Ferrovum sp.]|uniref:hypothetical protein n=1 Tax=Ferrovum sp. TaxID=2609467 RepID=UPI002639868E|nr:hypothetical protein [Ferrovum sp.]
MKKFILATLTGLMTLATVEAIAADATPGQPAPAPMAAPAPAGASAAAPAAEKPAPVKHGKKKHHHHKKHTRKTAPTN